MKPYDFTKNGVGYTFYALPDMAEAVVFDMVPETKPKPTPVPTPVPTPASGSIKAVVTKQDLSSMNVEYTNTTSISANLKIRVGSVDRPDRVIAPGKTAISTYTTTVKTGFTGQKIIVLHVETGKNILEQML